ncbi:MAG: purine-nucleoside phosphorylase [Deltaproteobacteria bacterium]|nr:purine-nucleoside phosphorylase [Deltaproteobacteria bacterium]
MAEHRKQILEAVSFLRDRIKTTPAVGILTGTGLQNAASSILPEFSIGYGDIPHFPVSTVEGHPGILTSGKISGRPVIVMKGRFHLYEGFSPTEVVFPVRVLQELGVKTLVISNAAGGLNHEFSPGDIMVISDHINLTGVNPLAGPNENDCGIRFPDMTRVYDKKLSTLAEKAGEQEKIPIKKGVYVGLRGPSLETPAETRFLRIIKADAVGFSTVCEAIAGVHAGMKIIGFSIITNINDPENPVPVTLEEVLEIAEKSALKVDTIIQRIVEDIDATGQDRHTDR